MSPSAMDPPGSATSRVSPSGSGSGSSSTSILPPKGRPRNTKGLTLGPAALAVDEEGRSAAAGEDVMAGGGVGGDEDGDVAFARLALGGSVLREHVEDGARAPHPSRQIKIGPTTPQSASDPASSTSSKSSLRIPTSSVSRKKPAGLSIKGIPSRAAPPQPLGGRSSTATEGSSTSGSTIRRSPSPSLVIDQDVDADIGIGSSRQTYHSKLSEQLGSLEVRKPSVRRKGSTQRDAVGHPGAGDEGGSSAAGSGGKKEKSKKHSRSAAGGAGAGGASEAEGEDERIQVKPEELKALGDLGAGSGGTVNLVVHQPTGVIMARKLVLIDAKPSVRKQILRELQIMHDCSSPWIVSFYGAFLADPHICICMEYMDRLSLDGIYRKFGPVEISVVGKIAEAVLEGLTYLYDVHRIIHRDIKPSNILVNSKGEIKICDFGVSGELINSIANTFVGTSTYMSPERIQGANYTVKSDVWSLGITLIELALGRFPFSDDDNPGSDDDSDLREMTQRGAVHDTQRTAGAGSAAPPPPVPAATSKAEKRKSKGVSLGGGGMTMSILDLLQHIVNEPAPRLSGPGRTFPADAEAFVEWCLQKDPALRANPKDLLVHEWIVRTKAANVDLEAWAATIA